MAQNINTSCDGCGAILYGKDKGIFRKSSHLQVNGQLVEQFVDHETGYQNHTFITPSSNEKLAFCLDTWQDCMKDYIDTRIHLWKQRREQTLRSQESEEEIARAELR